MEATQNKKGITMVSINLKCSDGCMIVKKNPKNRNIFYGCTNYYSDIHECAKMISLMQ